VLDLNGPNREEEPKIAPSTVKQINGLARQSASGPRADQQARALSDPDSIKTIRDDFELRRLLIRRKAAKQRPSADQHAAPAVAEL
jgi:hypothetical protein